MSESQQAQSHQQQSHQQPQYHEQDHHPHNFMVEENASIEHTNVVNQTETVAERAVNNSKVLKIIMTKFLRR